MDLALNDQQMLICHKTQPTNQPNLVDYLMAKHVYTYTSNIYDFSTNDI